MKKRIDGGKGNSSQAESKRKKTAKQQHRPKVDGGWNVGVEGRVPGGQGTVVKTASGGSMEEKLVFPNSGSKKEQVAVRK